MTIYQVLPRLFGNRNVNPMFNGSLKQNGCGKLSAFTGLELNEIKQMGFTHIWYTGLLEHATQTDYSAFGIRKDHPAIVKGIAGSPYAIKDYYDIDPDLADNVENRMAEFEALVQRTHEAGLKVIIDFVPNHVAREYYSDTKPDGIEDLGASDNKEMAFAANNNFYYIPGQAFQPNFELTDKKGQSYTEYPAKATGNDCFSAHPHRLDWYETVKLNYGVDYLNSGKTHFDPVPDTWNKMLDILRFWAGKKIDGFRCDMAEMVPVEFWEWAIPQVKEASPGIIFIAEVYNPGQYRNYLYKGKFDYLYDKVGLYDTLRLVMNGYKTADEITYCWQAVDDIQSKMLNFLENHDEQRIASDFFAGDPIKGRPALVVSATMNTNPFMVYFGQELGERGMEEEGFSGRDGRTSIFDYWNLPVLDRPLSDAQKKLREYYTKIVQLCNQSKAIRQGAFFDLMYANLWKKDFDSNKQYAFMRYLANELLLIVANFDDKTADINLRIPPYAFEYFGISEGQIGKAKDLLTGTRCSSHLRTDNVYPVHILAYNAVIIRFEIHKDKVIASSEDYW
ncbi:alpha-amylase [Bacteroidia bacterium]|nr:alpha-amylase [Bacteroidia bacterium]